MIVIGTSIVELGLFRDDYEALVEALRAEGLEARIEEPREDRSIEQTALEVGIWVGDHIGDLAAGVAVVDAVRRAASATISKRKRARKTQELRRLPIYGSGDQIHGWVDLPPSEGAEE